MISARDRCVATLSVGAALFVVTATLVTGCSGAGGPATPGPDVAAPGDIPDDQAFVEVTPFPGFAVTVPEGWAMTAAGPAVTFTDKLNAITVDSRFAATAPSETAVHQDVDQQFASAAGYVAGTVTSVTRPAGTAVEATYRIAGPTNPVSGKSVTDEVERYEFFRDGQLVTLTMSAPVGADNVDPWRTVTDSFRWTS
ncbi:hypothetical protein [Rhodococcus koreensis]|uniref:hypothetical protein n=1 Tax=Rhodococcus koreensis TaxID=99653 RepID=UPI001981A530|nr:hypothetical protein [Rhodococcus koreensis]QSE84757.1 hypothetical protein JWS14_39465 [Rhodococcus koreensis]